MSRRTVKRSERVLSPWVRLVERTVSDDGREEIYHSLAQNDYVCTVAITSSDELVCVRQYRPAVDRVTVELPAGLLGADETPLDCAMRELAEETGFGPTFEPRFLGHFLPDTGRLENRLWIFVADHVIPFAGWAAESGVERRLIPFAEVPRLIADGSFAHALHIGAIGLAVMQGVLPQLSAASWPKPAMTAADGRILSNR